MLIIPVIHFFLSMPVQICYLLSAKAIPHSFSKSLNSLVHIIGRGRCISRSEEQSWWCLVLLSQEPRASGDEDTIFDTRIEYLLLYIKDTSLSCLGMFCVIDFDPHLTRS